MTVRMDNGNIVSAQALNSFNWGFSVLSLFLHILRLNLLFSPYAITKIINQSNKIKNKTSINQTKYHNSNEIRIWFPLLPLYVALNFTEKFRFTLTQKCILCLMIMYLVVICSGPLLPFQRHMILTCVRRPFDKTLEEFNQSLGM